MSNDKTPEYFTVAELAENRRIAGFVQHHNGIFPWAINTNGEVTNAIA